MIRNFRDLEVWRLGMALVEEVYRLTDNLPAGERYGLSGQMRRAAVSIPSNIAEGHNRDHLGDYLRFLSVAQGSLAELETQIEVASRLGYLSQDRLESGMDQRDCLGRKLRVLQKSLRKIDSK
jgi:four helix bundle protein